jgi:lipopolysaccharide transport system permease protein
MNPNEVISHIEPKKKWLDVDLKGLWRYRDLYYMNVKRDLITQYKQTIMGPLWYLIQPMLTTIMYMLVFGGLAGISTDGVPQPLFYLCGVCLWTYFNSCFTSCSNVFAANQGVFGKVYFPRLVVPLSSVTSNLIRFAIQFGMFIAVYLYYIIVKDYTISLGFVNDYGYVLGTLVTVFLSLLFVFMVGMHAMSWGLIITSLTTKYRDLNLLVAFGVQLLMYATPVIYPLSFAPVQYHVFLNANPLTPIFEAFKYTFVGAGTFDVVSLGYSLVTLCIVMFFAVIFFNRTEQRFMDTV